VFLLNNSRIQYFFIKKNILYIKLTNYSRIIRAHYDYGNECFRPLDVQIIYGIINYFNWIWT
jgi:hypothetical protein